jgi:hypothetical protein
MIIIRQIKFQLNQVECYRLCCPSNDKRNITSMMKLDFRVIILMNPHEQTRNRKKKVFASLTSFQVFNTLKSQTKLQHHEMKLFEK